MTYEERIRTIVPEQVYGNGAMGFRHLTSKQNAEIAGLLIAAAKALGIATLVALFFGGSVNSAHPLAWLAAFAVTILLAVLGVMLVGRVGESDGQAETSRSQKKRGRS